MTWAKIFPPTKNETHQGHKIRNRQPHLHGLTEGDGTGHEGYSCWDYFRDGVYLGADEHGIEPIFTSVRE